MSDAPNIVGRTVAKAQVLADVARVKADTEAQIAAWNERAESLNGALVCRCAKCPGWLGHSLDEHAEHMETAHGFPRVEKLIGKGSHKLRCSVCGRGFRAGSKAGRYCPLCKEAMKDKSKHPNHVPKPGLKMPSRSHPLVPPKNPKSCIDCGVSFVPASGAISRCPPCREAHQSRKKSGG